MATVLISGASRGIGLELAHQYAREGWRVIATCRNPADAGELRGVQGEVAIYRLDVCNPRSIKKLQAQVESEPIDLLFNNAGKDARPAPTLAIPQCLPTYEASEWSSVFQTNVIGPYILTQTLMPNLMASSRGLVVAISSRMGSIALNLEGGFYPYRASKAALNMLIKGWSVDLAEKGVCFVAIHPGRVKTSLGGADAPLDVGESVSRLRDVVKTVSAANNGSFLDLYGNTLKW